MFDKLKSEAVWVTAIIIAVAIFASASVFTYGFFKSRVVPNTITVTGSAKKQIKSDYVIWRATVSRQAANISDTYKLLQGDMDKVKKYLADNGLAEKDYTISSVSTYTINTILPNGTYSNNIEAYRLSQEIEIRSYNVDKVTVLSRESTKLIQDGVELQSMPPSYYYTKIADLKVDMLALATKDAKLRAEKIAENSSSALGKLKSAKMGVFQITPVNSEEISDYGINDTSSIDKQIMAVVNCVYTSN
ncbi:MAG: SIMPL domain-containing protein [Clostridiaceae bacterium]